MTPTGPGEKAARRDDGVVIWRFPTVDGTIDVEGATEQAARDKIAAAIATSVVPPLPAAADAVLAAIESLDPAKATIPDVIAAVRSALMAAGAKLPPGN